EPAMRRFSVLSLNVLLIGLVCSQQMPGQVKTQTPQRDQSDLDRDSSSLIAWLPDVLASLVDISQLNTDAHLRNAIHKGSSNVIGEREHQLSLLVDEACTCLHVI